MGYANKLTAQFTLSGTVYDSSKLNLVEGVRVVSTGGMFVFTDSMGRYNITVTDKDSVYFSYQNKPTLKFAIKTISDPANFNIALRIKVRGRYITLKEVIVYSKNYRQDSLENRQLYADVYNYSNPTLRSNISPDGVPGADLDELINMFRFKRNKRLRAFQQRLETQEQEKYVNYRFNKNLVHRITQLSGVALDSFLVLYRPSYEFVSTADEVLFNQYVLEASYQYKNDLLKQEGKK